MNFKESDLPGIGKKFTIETQSGQFLSVVLLLNGNREVFIFDDPEDDPLLNFKLTEDEANLFGSILMGTYFKPEQEKEKELLMNRLSIEWVRISEKCLLAGKSILEQQVRMKTGITIIAIIRENETIINPNPETIIKINDTLVVVGERDKTKVFNDIYQTTK